MKKIIAMPLEQGETVYCFALYAWDKELSPDLLNVIECIFQRYGAFPGIATGYGSEDQKSHGKYDRVRTRLASFIRGKFFSFRINGQQSFVMDSFYPCDMQFVLNVSNTGYKHGMFSARAHIGKSLKGFIATIQEFCFDLVGSVYATGFEFPAPYGPDAYLASVSAFPKGYSTVDAEYSNRITRWRDRTRRDWTLPRKGFLREVYPINFLLEQHLKASIGDCTLMEYAGSMGKLEKCQPGLNMWRWDVPISNLDRVREELETSGLILSSETPPRL